ncbi:MAG: AAA family ATPase, partial [Muribaculaceae bacterium]|nr:AAA family ATPase [Muribaculaceae bacterium]
MIKSLLLKNWKSFESAQLWVDPLTFIIGTNSAGKSNIVDALSFLSYVATGNRISDSVSTIRGAVEGLIKRNEDFSTLNIVLLIGKDEFTYEISFVLENKELLIREEKLVIKTVSGKEKILFSTDEVESGSNQIVARFQKDKAGPLKGLSVKRDISILSQIPNLNVIKEIKEKAELVSSSLKSIFILDPK